MAQSIPTNPSFGKPKSPFEDTPKGGRDRGPLVSPPARGEIGEFKMNKVAAQRKGGNSIMKVGKK